MSYQEDGHYNGYRMADLWSLYAPQVENLFDYLNGTVNKRINCRLNIAYYSFNNYAQFQRPNLVTVFLASIINGFYSGLESHDKVMSVIALTITHELFHADQEIDSHKYKIDGAYATNVENAAEYSAELFCIAHKQSFKKLFGFTYGFNVNKKLAGSVYYPFSDDTYYENLFVGMFRSIIIGQELTKLCKEHDNVGIILKYKDQTWNKVVKLYGEYTVGTEDINYINSILSFFRFGTASCNYKMTYSTGIGTLVNLKGIDVEAGVLELEIVPYDYAPFVYD